MTNPNKNWNCDNDKCRDSKSEVRVFKLGDGGSNLILCPACWQYENSFRASKGGEKNGWHLRNWAAAEVYHSGYDGEGVAIAVI